jgi:hypothetical protein
MAKYVRARRGVGILLHPDTGALITPSPDVPVNSTDPLVKKFPWAFVSDEDLAAEMEQAAAAASPTGDVEEATARPGEKRVTSAKKSTRQ